MTIGLDCGLKEQPGSFVDLIADQLHVKADDLPDVLDNWTLQQYLEHCAKLAAAELKPPSMRRRF